MKQVIVIVCLLLVLQLCTSQNYVDDKQVIDASGLTTVNSQFNFVSNNATIAQAATTTQPSNTPNNAIFIEQVGFGNVVNAQVSADNSQIFINQDGSFNVTGLRLNAQNIQQSINQIGNGNLMLDYSVHGAQLHQVNVNQLGNYNTTISTGRNGISERLQVTQQGTGSTVYVLHF